ncbi:4Fe-4S ferredoxin [Ignisphaera sp. 4213-co]|uniref:4Fe-4S ferredoxin n=1 Tax=Ignisphaera cupida TaxID=3050454 RepID=A0ABD4Z796_9CREN|nr:4Fe-4S ferredoxin [Ignisphaera sp. 4213-co]MDK6028180.1 4Fe-4S ferredoxin [Ignisphaera sp. 4213-co]
MSACLKIINNSFVEELAKGKVVLYACPEREHPALYGKIASIIRSSKPRSVTVVTVDGSPHCFQLHAAVNEAEYILGEKINKKHYVVVDGEKVVEISPDAVRVARYLHLVNKLIKSNNDVLEELKQHSLEYRKLLELQQKQSS